MKHTVTYKTELNVKSRNETSQIWITFKQLYLQHIWRFRDKLSAGQTFPVQSEVKSFQTADVESEDFRWTRERSISFLFAATPREMKPKRLLSPQGQSRNEFGDENGDTFNAVCSPTWAALKTMNMPTHVLLMNTEHLDW